MTCGNLQKYRSLNPLQRYLINRFLKSVSSLIKENEIFNLLDVGCAEGFVMNYLSKKYPDINYLGLDINPESIKFGENAFKHLKYMEGDIYSLKFEDNSFDLVLATEILEHLKDPVLAINEVKRVSGKYCLFSVPHEPLFKISNFLRGKNISRFGNDIEHINHWNEKSFSKLLISSNFKIIEMKKSFPWIICLAEV